MYIWYILNFYIFSHLIDFFPPQITFLKLHLKFTLSLAGILVYPCQNKFCYKMFELFNKTCFNLSGMSSFRFLWRFSVFYYTCFHSRLISAMILSIGRRQKRIAIFPCLYVPKHLLIRQYALSQLRSVFCWLLDLGFCSEYHRPLDLL